MFHWDKMYKHEENIERDIIERVMEYVCEFYTVDDIFDLSEDQIMDIENFCNNDLNEYSVMQVGFREILNQLDDPDMYMDDESEDE